ncbi:hypothetical protein CHS0354_018864 [Potamilus streckersoni]|uniref:G-protein coupled receptors family 1 profile domain-containing protein n=1 Tax=Potamilus streckersoni TaxID=2493646 RepID=A0AAE0SBT7_9BIVA|nr:hypothetical protein CHS0354_018864 [Potamilus streckersoni]
MEKDLLIYPLCMMIISYTELSKVNIMAYNVCRAVNVTNQNMECNSVSPTSINKTIAGLLIVTVVVGSLGNILIAVTILKTKMFRKPVYALLLQVATLNVLFQTIVVPINIYAFFHNSWTPSIALCTMIVYMTNTLLCTTRLLLILVSVYRCIHVCYNNLYMKIKTPRVVAVFCLLVWVKTILIICLVGKKVSFSREYVICIFESVQHLQIFLSIFIYIPMAIIPTSMYIKIAVFVRNAQMRVLPQGRTASENHKKSQALTRMTALISLNHLVTVVLPAIFIMVDTDNRTMKKNLIAAAVFLFRLTSTFDFIIYIFSSRTMRSMIANIFTSLMSIDKPRDTQLQQHTANGNRF